jgi:2-amino-4-hydroxy-6-hydroxymethyldihydropteridine diphosphokinase
MYDRIPVAVSFDSADADGKKLPQDDMFSINSRFQRSKHSMTAYLSLGSNLGDRMANLRTCIARLGSVGRVKKISSFYETEPMELREQPWFVNCVVELETDLSPEMLLAEIRRIETDLGRTRNVPKGPRLIDIDILLLDSLVIKEKDLQIPHPALHQRRFVLEPLTEIAPEAPHPALSQTARELLQSLPLEAGIVRRLPIR